MKVGFIGIGSMGSLLIDAFITSGALRPDQVQASNRTYAKAQHIALRHPGLQAMQSNLQTIDGCDIVFLCIKPHEYKPVLDELKNHVKPEQIFVSITSPVLLQRLEGALPCKIAKVIPSITNYVCAGATLCMYGPRMKSHDVDKLHQLLEFISSPLQIDERHTRIVSDLSSCGPAFFAFVLQRFVDAAVEETGIDRAEAIAIASTMLSGTGQLLTSGGMTPEQLQKRVSVPGGITAQALELLEQKLDGVFNAVIQTTHAKYGEDLSKVEEALHNEEVNGS